MAASDHVGEHIMRVYHASRDVEPPHEVELPHGFILRGQREMEYEQGAAYTNTHPDIIHAGTHKAASELGGGIRPYIHAYDVDTREMSPVTYDDAPGMGETNVFQRSMSGVQQSLWESVPSTGEETLKHGRVQPYRNKVEDAGSVSFMIPKSAITAGRVTYVGEVGKEKK